jgi:hypothetical protein
MMGSFLEMAVLENSLGTQVQSSPPREDWEKARKLLELLDIDIVGGTHVHIISLYEILMDEKKFKTLVCKMNNKAFW